MRVYISIFLLGRLFIISQPVGIAAHAPTGPRASSGLVHLFLSLAISTAIHIVFTTPRLFFVPSSVHSSRVQTALPPAIYSKPGGAATSWRESHLVRRKDIVYTDRVQEGEHQLLSRRKRTSITLHSVTWRSYGCLDRFHTPLGSPIR